MQHGGLIYHQGSQFSGTLLLTTLKSGTYAMNLALLVKSPVREPSSGILLATGI